MHCDPSSASRASSLAHRVTQMKHSRCPVLRDLWPAQAREEGWPDGSQRWWPLEEEPGAWLLQVGSHRLACLALPKSLLSPTVHWQQGSACLLAPAQPCLPLLAIPTSYLPHHGWQWIYGCCLLPSFTLLWCHVLLSIWETTFFPTPSARVLMISLLGNKHGTRLEPVRVFLATVSGTWPTSKPGRSFLGLWVNQLDKWICSFPLDWKPQGMKGLELLLPSGCQVEHNVVGL